MTYITTGIAPETPTTLPNLLVFGLAVAGLENTKGKIDLDALRVEAIRSLSARDIDIENVAATTPFKQWRAAFSAMGLQPSKTRSSVEQLARRALNKGEVPPTGIELVDLYNIASVSFLTPMGGYDLAKVTGPVDIRPSRDGDTFEPIGGDPKDFPMGPRVIVYAQESQVMCFGLNHRDDIRTAITADTTEALFFAEALADADAGAAHRALSWLSHRLRAAGAMCGPVFQVGSADPSVLPWDEAI